MNLRRLISAWPLLEQQNAIIEAQRTLIDHQNAEIHRVHLEHLREMRGIVSGWILSLEQPEVDLRDDLFELDREIANRVAQVEEHVL